MDRFLSKHWGRGILLEYVFLEVMTVLLVRRDLETAIRVGRVLLEARELDFAPCSEIFPETVEYFSSQTKTRLSFADAAIAVVAQSRAQGQVLTFDEEFRRIDGLQIFPELGAPPKPPTQPAN